MKKFPYDVIICQTELRSPRNVHMLPTLQKIKFKQFTPVCLSFQGRGLTINDQIQDRNFMNSIHFSVFNQMKEFWEDSDS